MPQIVFPEFRDYTRSTKYPFVDEATLTSNGANNTDKITLPNDIFIDVNMFLPGTTVHCILMAIIVMQNKVQLVFGGGADLNCYGVISTIQDIADEDIVIPLYLDGKRTGTVLMNKLKLAYFRGLPLGRYLFNPDNSARLVPSCIRTIPQLGINSVAVNEKTEENTVKGKIWLIGHNGVFLRTQEGMPNTIRIDVVGDSLYKKAAENLKVYEIAKPVRTINGVNPDSYGSFNITTTSTYDALRIQNKPDGIQIYMAGAINGN